MIMMIVIIEIIVDLIELKIATKSLQKSLKTNWRQNKLKWNIFSSPEIFSQAAIFTS